MLELINHLRRRENRASVACRFSKLGIKRGAATGITANITQTVAQRSQKTDGLGKALKKL